MNKLTFSLILLLFPLQAACEREQESIPPSDKIAKAQGWKKETVVAGLENPWSMAWLPDGSMLITERPGRIRRFKDGVLGKESLSGIPKVLSSGQGGLLDISLHPKFSENNLLYFTYAAGTADSNRTTLARARLSGGALEDVRTIWENPDVKPGTQHFGSRITWLDDGTLLMSVGDGGNPPTELNGGLIRRYAQDRSNAFGKILRLKDDGSIPADNPFAEKENERGEIYSYGHRNIQGLVFDSATKRVWANEHGSRGGDELNLIERGQNYGWPLASYSMEYFGGPVARVKSSPEFKDPKLVWTPSPAPSGITVYTGNRFPQWKGDLLSGNLAGKHVRRIDLDGDRVLGEEALDIGKRVRDVRVGPDGELYLLTDEGNGELLRIVPAS